ncbi:hypothetical protein A33Q_2885 [Indibacter alkaliphilus LW1]|uniref:Uncharacterized protein n=1 Tax=Indibacter alkaliphilus (strain CCUG 57479 / KCTC 22604 / LW1) TaxID=1189612 RepID=S2E0F6_INDAL|nr:hypothetical protein A33Q_2885 [Indibacter alkaliphilus LW1]
MPIPMLLYVLIAALRNYIFEVLDPRNRIGEFLRNIISERS